MMAVCSRCGISDQEARLYDAIYPQEVLQLCHVCAEAEGVPLLRAATTEQLKDAERTQGVYERLSKSAGLAVDPEKIPKRTPVHLLEKRKNISRTNYSRF